VIYLKLVVRVVVNVEVIPNVNKVSL